METIQGPAIGDDDETTERSHMMQTIVSKFTQELLMILTLEMVSVMK